MSKEEALRLLSIAIPLARQLISTNGKRPLSQQDLGILQGVKQIYEAHLLSDGLIEEVKMSWDEIAILLGMLAVHHAFLSLSDKYAAA